MSTIKVDKIQTRNTTDNLIVELSSGQRVARFDSGDNTSAFISFKAPNTSLPPSIGVKDEDLFFSTGDAVERARFDADSNGDLILQTGNLKIGAAGKGIDFSSAAATTSGQSGGTDPAETSTGTLLDDYEEGYFTPISNSVTVGSGTITAEGMYVKVGNLVNVTVRFNPTGASTSGHQFDIYLPFKAATTETSGSFNTYTGTVRFASASFDPRYIFVQLPGDENTAGIRRQDTANIYQVKGSDVGAGFNMDFTLTYRTV